MTLLDKDYTPELLSLESYRNAIAVEAGVVGKAIDTLKRFLPGFAQGINTKVSSFTGSQTPPTIKMSKNQKKAFETLRSVDHMTLSTFAVHVHEGFNGKLLEFTPVLQELLDDMNTVAGMVNDYRVFLSAVISDKNSRMNTHTYFAKYKAKARQSKQLMETVNSFYKANSYQGKRKFADVFDRNSDAEKFVLQINDIKEALDKYPLGSLRKDVDQCVELLNIFIKRIETGDIDNVSNEVALDVSEMAYLIAQQTESVALNYHRIGIFAATASDLTDMLAGINPN